MERKKKDRSFCCVPQCKIQGGKYPNVSFHKFPAQQTETEQSRRKEWIRVLRIGKEVSSRMSVCSQHFKETDYILPGVPTKRPHLKKIAVPSLNLPLRSTDDVRKLDEKARRVEERSYRFASRSEKKDLAAQSPVENERTVDGDKLLAAEALLQLSEAIDNEIDIDDLIVPPIQLKLHKGTQVKSGDFDSTVLIKIERLSSKQLNSLTGIPSMSLFNKLVEFLEKELEKHPKRQLSTAEQVVLTMMRIKLNVSFCVIAIIFGCTSTTCRTVFDETVHGLASILQTVVEFPSKEIIFNNMPKCFEKFQRVRVVLDCTEIPVVKPKCLKCRIMTYSQYYGEHTLKYMICSTSGGTISFVSKGYGKNYKIIINPKKMHTQIDQVYIP